jgi:hypothetical protein
MCFLSKNCRESYGQFQVLKQEIPDRYLKNYKEREYKMLSRLDLELLERSLGLEVKKYNLISKKEFDKAQMIFSRILMAAAMLTLGLILLSSFEIPFVNVSPEIVKLMISAVIVEIAGIVSLGLMKHFGKEDKEKKE